MQIRIALAGNPNCGKTTMFNVLTGSAQYVGNWPGVTVEKKEGYCKGDKSIVITDLPGVYSLSPYSPEEIVSRDYLIEERPDVIVNLVDATNLERNLYLTTQIVNLGLPVVVALNMSDLVKKNGDVVYPEKLSEQLGCPVVETSALKNEGLEHLVDVAVSLAKEKRPATPSFSFDAEVEDALSEIEECIGEFSPKHLLRWNAIKVFEGEERTIDALSLPPDVLDRVSKVRTLAEEHFDDDAESIMTSERYDAIAHIVDGTLKKSAKGMTLTQKIDRVVTNRWLGLPIFVLVMTFVYYLAVSVGGGVVTDWANDGISGDGWLYTGGAAYEEAVASWEESIAEAEAAGDGALVDQLSEEEPDPSAFGLWIPGLTPIVSGALESIGCAAWLQSLVVDGIVAGVGAVIGFIPQMVILFVMLSFLEGCGYMARVAFIMDRIFRKFGLSGKSFIPMLIASGCGVPAVMATKTIENEKDRRMTIMTTTMIPCGAKLPIIALVFGALAGQVSDDVWWVAPMFYFMGVAAIIISGIMLRKTRMFAGEATPFIMELPQYHLPTVRSVLMAMWERVRSYIIKAGTIIFLSTIVIWFLMNFGFYEGSFTLLDSEMDDYIQYSFMAMLGSVLAPLFAPLGFGDWQSAATSVTGLVAKENVVATVGIITSLGDAGEADPGMWEAFGAMMGGSAPAIMAFCAFNLLCAPCFAAIGTIRRQMASAKWTWFAIGYMTVFAYAVALMIYQFGMFFSTGSFTIATAFAVIVLAGMLFQIFRPMPRFEDKRQKNDRLVFAYGKEQ